MLVCGGVKRDREEELTERWELLPNETLVKFMLTLDYPALESACQGSERLAQVCDDPWFKQQYTKAHPEVFVMYINEWQRVWRQDAQPIDFLDRWFEAAVLSGTWMKEWHNDFAAEWAAYYNKPDMLEFVLQNAQEKVLTRAAYGAIKANRANVLNNIVVRFENEESWSNLAYDIVILDKPDMLRVILDLHTFSAEVMKGLFRITTRPVRGIETFVLLSEYQDGNIRNNVSAAATSVAVRRMPFSQIEHLLEELPKYTETILWGAGDGYAQNDDAENIERLYAFAPNKARFVLHVIKKAAQFDGINIVFMLLNKYPQDREMMIRAARQSCNRIFSRNVSDYLSSLK